MNQGDGTADSEALSGPGVSDAIHLVHRRRGWIWTAVGSIVAWLVTLGLLGGLAPNAAGVLLTVVGLLVVVLTVLAIVGVVMTVIDTVRLRRSHPGIRAATTHHFARHPARSHPYRYPPRHRFSWIFAWAMMLSVFGLGIAALPALVDGIAYLAGAEPTTTFTPVSYSQDCGRSGCSTVTDGFISNGTGVTWPDQVPVGQPFTVHEPLWNWGFGTGLIDSDWSAIGSLFAGVLFDSGAVFIGYAMVKVGRNWVRHRRHMAELTGAGTLSG